MKSKPMLFQYAILMLLIILSCGEKENERGYEIPNLKENIKAFIDAKKCFEKPAKILLVNLQVNNDTLSVEIADTYPKVKEMKFNYDTLLYEHRIIFTGEKINGFSKKSSTTQFPSDIIKVSETRDWPFHEELTIWSFLYKSDKLIYKDTPCAENK